MLNRVHCTSREEWLATRSVMGLGASQSSAALGLNPFQSNLELWQELTGKNPPQDLSENKAVQYGSTAEEYIRELFILEHPEFEVKHFPFDILQNSEYLHIFATLDGEILEKETGKKGILEIKTAEPMNAVAWEEWQDQIPQRYYVQILQQLAVTGWDFVVVRVRIINRYDRFKAFDREYRFERADCLEDMEFVVNETRKFYEYVKTNRQPPLRLPQI